MTTGIKIPLFVDLDGTLIYSDLLYESFLCLIRKNFVYLFIAPFWLLGGKANFKYQIARRTEVKVNLLPYNRELLVYLEEQSESGRSVILISASNEKFVEQVADYIGLFDQAIGSSESDNLKGENKLTRIRQIVGDSQFEYAGNDSSDVKIWQEASAATVVNASRKLTSDVVRQQNVVNKFPGKDHVYASFIKALRPHQWAKNLLLFLPLILSHQVDDIGRILMSLTAFVSFSFCASSVYLLNDMLDLEHDRQHPSKHKRPFASGELTIAAGLIACPLFLVMAFLLALPLPAQYLIILALYYLTTVVYSFWLKAIAIVDVLVLASLYTIRIIAGAAAISVMPTFWLLAFSMFLFMSLAIVKRFTELDNLQYMDKERAEGRGYHANDLNVLSMLGTASGFMAVLVFALYINDDETRLLYSTPQVLWFICPLLLYLMSRIWLKAHRGLLHEDPVVFAITDRASQIVTLVCGALIWASTLPWDFY